MSYFRSIRVFIFILALILNAYSVDMVLAITPSPTSATKTPTAVTSPPKVVDEASCKCSPQGTMPYCGCQVTTKSRTTFFPASGVTELGCQNETGGGLQVGNESIGLPGSNTPATTIISPITIGTPNPQIYYTRCFREPVDKVKSDRCNKELVTYFKNLSSNDFKTRDAANTRIKDCLFDGNKLMNEYIWTIIDELASACKPLPNPGQTKQVTIKQTSGDFTVNIDVDVCVMKIQVFTSGKENYNCQY